MIVDLLFGGPFVAGLLCALYVFVVISTCRLLYRAIHSPSSSRVRVTVWCVAAIGLAEIVGAIVLVLMAK